MIRDTSPPIKSLREVQVEMNRRILALLAGLTAATLIYVCSCDDNGNLTGGSNLNPFTDTTYIRDYAYVEGRIFDLGYDGDFEPLDSIRTIHVFKRPRRDSVQQVSALFFIDPNSGSTDYDSMRVEQIPAEQYEIWQIADRNLRYIYFDIPLRDALGIYMEIDRYNESGFVRRDIIGSVEQLPYRLKSLRASDVDYVPTHPTWQLMWRNCYRIPRGISVDDLRVRVRRGLSGREQSKSSLPHQMYNNTIQAPYLEILGLDQYKESGRKIPDGRLDERIMLFQPDWGLLIFPHRTPFDCDTTFVNANGVETVPLKVRTPTIYNYVSKSQQAGSSQYFIELATRLQQPPD